MNVSHAKRSQALSQGGRLYADDHVLGGDPCCRLGHRLAVGSQAAAVPVRSDRLVQDIRVLVRRPRPAHRYRNLDGRNGHCRNCGQRLGIDRCWHNDGRRDLVAHSVSQSFIQVKGWLHRVGF